MVDVRCVWIEGGIGGEGKGWDAIMIVPMKNGKKNQEQRKYLIANYYYWPFTDANNTTAPAKCIQWTYFELEIINSYVYACVCICVCAWKSKQFVVLWWGISRIELTLKLNESFVYCCNAWRLYSSAIPFNHTHHLLRATFFRHKFIVLRLHHALHMNCSCNFPNNIIQVTDCASKRNNMEFKKPQIHW